MSNMSYCRFENTLRALSDCQEGLEGLFEGGTKLSDSELRHAKELIKGCIDILSVVAEQAGIDLSDEDGIDELESSVSDIMNEANDAAE